MRIKLSCWAPLINIHEVCSAVVMGKIVKHQAVEGNLGTTVAAAIKGIYAAVATGGAIGAILETRPGTRRLPFTKKGKTVHIIREKYVRRVGRSKGLTNRSSIEPKLPYMYCNQRMYNRRSRNSWQRRRHCRQSLSQNCKNSGESSSRKNTLSYIPMEPPFTIRHTYLAQLSFLYLPLHSTYSGGIFYIVRYRNSKKPRKDST